MDIIHLDEKFSYHRMSYGTVCGYGSDEDKATLQVKLPYMKEGKDILEHVELLLPFGGSAYGFLCRPEIGDQVLLQFYGNEQQHAVAIGSLASTASTLWDICSEQNEQKYWKMKYGMSLSIWDEEDASRAEVLYKDGAVCIDEKEQQMKLSFQENHVLLDGKLGCIELTAEKEMKFICGDSSLLMKQDGTMQLTGKKLEIKGDTLTVETAMDTSVNGQNVKLGGKLKVSINGKSGVDVASNGITQIQGGMVKLG